MGSRTHCSKNDGFPGTHGTHVNGATEQPHTLLLTYQILMQMPYRRLVTPTQRFKTTRASSCVRYANVNSLASTASKNIFQFTPEKFNTSATCVGTFLAKKNTFWIICENTLGKCLPYVKSVVKLLTRALS